MQLQKGFERIVCIAAVRGLRNVPRSTPESNSRGGSSLLYPIWHKIFSISFIFIFSTVIRNFVTAFSIKDNFLGFPNLYLKRLDFLLILLFVIIFLSLINIHMNNFEKWFTVIFMKLFIKEISEVNFKLSNDKNKRIDKKFHSKEGFLPKLWLC